MIEPIARVAPWTFSSTHHRGESWRRASTWPRAAPRRRPSSPRSSLRWRSSSPRAGARRPPTCLERASLADTRSNVSEPRKSAGPGCELGADLRLVPVLPRAPRPLARVARFQLPTGADDDDEIQAEAWHRPRVREPNGPHGSTVTRVRAHRKGENQPVRRTRRADSTLSNASRSRSRAAWRRWVQTVSWDSTANGCSGHRSPAPPNHV